MQTLKTMFENGPLPIWFISLLLLAIGWMVAIVVRLVVTKVLEGRIFSGLWQKSAFHEFLRKGHVHYSPPKLLGAITYWIMLLVVLFLCSSLIDVNVASMLSKRFVSAAPGIVAALFTLIIGAIIVTFIGNFVMTVARNAALPHARLLSQAVKGLGMLLVLAVAVEQVNVATTLITSMLLMLFGAIVFALGLAFGLGGKDIAREAMEKILKNLREQDRSHKDPDLEG